jgi:hypothetical protein
MGAIISMIKNKNAEEVIIDFESNKKKKKKK